MEPGRQRLAAVAARFAASAPPEVLNQVAAGIAGCLVAAAVVSARAVAESVANPRHRALAAEFVEVWQRCCPTATALDAATMLWSAATTADYFRTRQRLELVWTGPPTPSIPVRQTEEIVAGMIDGAVHTLTLTSFGVYPVSRLGQALRAAADRGVAVRIVLGDRKEDRGELRDRYDEAFGPALPDNYVLFHWPNENRLRSHDGKVGLMHAKCAVADAEHLFLTSANLSGNAMTVNMELGLCIHGGALPEQVERHFDALIARGELTRFQ